MNGFCSIAYYQYFLFAAHLLAPRACTTLLVRRLLFCCVIVVAVSALFYCVNNVCFSCNKGGWKPLTPAKECIPRPQHAVIDNNMMK